LKKSANGAGLYQWELMLGTILLAPALLMTVFGAALAPYSPTAIALDSGEVFGIQEAPSQLNLLGTTAGGMDVLSRLIWSAQPGLIAGLATAVIAITIGFVMGILSATLGGKVDDTLVAVTNFLFATPALLVALTLAVTLNSGRSSLLAAIVATIVAESLVIGSRTFRVVRAETQVAMRQDFITAARALGAGTSWIALRHISKNVTQSLPLFAGMAFADSIGTLSALGFLGLGADMNVGAELGSDIRVAISGLSQGVWWPILPPAILLLMTLAGISLLADGLEQRTRNSSK
jgi:peptide/nickel transport system permease protein